MCFIQCVYYNITVRQYFLSVNSTRFRAFSQFRQIFPTIILVSVLKVDEVPILVPSILHNIICLL